MKKKIYQPKYILKHYAAYDVFRIPPYIRKMSKEELEKAMLKQEALVEWHEYHGADFKYRIRQAKKVRRNHKKNIDS